MLHILNCPWRPWQICSCLRTHPLLQYFQVFEAKQPLMCLFWSSQELLKFPVYIWTFFQNLEKNYEIIALCGRPAATTLMADGVQVAQAIRLQHLHKYTSRILPRIIRININSININQSCPVKIAMNHATWDVYC